MKIVISTQTNSAEGPFDPRFGRAAYFCIYDTETESWQAHDNQAIQATGGAGVQASQFIAQKGAQVAISGDFGPNAYMTLSAAGIQMFLAPAGENVTAQELLARYQAGQLKQVAGPTHGGNHGTGR